MFYMPHEPGKFTFTVHVLCDSYLGCDKKEALSLHVLPRPEVEVKNVTLADDDEADSVEKVCRLHLWKSSGNALFVLLLCVRAFGVR